MQINFKSSYSYLISHTFPGLLLGLEIILAFALFTPLDGFKLIYEINYKPITLIPLLIVLYVISTLLGLIVDAIHHYFFRDLEEKLESAKIYKYIKTNDQLQIFTKIDDDYWYAYETYGNIAFSMIPGIIFISILLFQLKVHLLFILIFIMIYFYIIWILISESRYTLINILKDVEKNFIENLRGNIGHDESNEN